MPSAAPKPCVECQCLVYDGTSRCADHKLKAWRKTGDGKRTTGRPWRRIRDRVLQRDAGVCLACAAKGITAAATEVDHILRVEDGGTDDEGNLQSLCSDCHEAKTVAENRKGRGVEKSGGDQADTDPLTKFLRAGVLAGGVGL